MGKTKLPAECRIHKQGPYQTESQAMQRKAFLKKHVPHAKFTVITGKNNKFSFMSKAEKIERLPGVLIPAAIKAHVSTGVPGEKVSVFIVK